MVVLTSDTKIVPGSIITFYLPDATPREIKVAGYDPVSSTWYTENGEHYRFSPENYYSNKVVPMFCYSGSCYPINTIGPIRITYPS